MIKEFFGIGGYQRPAEGAYSWQHLTFVTFLMIVMVTCAILIGKRYQKADDKRKNFVLIVTAIAIDSLEIFKILLHQYTSPDPLAFLYVLPLFLCSIQLITIPVAACTTGRVKEACLDFIFIFGILGAVLGTYGAAQNYACYPVLSFDNVVSGLTHSLSGFASLYIAISGMLSMKKKNIWITFSIIGAFCVAAYLANILVPDGYNYMFLMRGDGTPYDIFFNLVNGHPVFYPLIVVGLFLLYIFVFYQIYYLIQNKRNKTKKQASDESDACQNEKEIEQEKSLV